MRKILSKSFAGMIMTICLLCSMNAFAQSKLTVSGVVRDTNAEPLVGVSILENGSTANATVSNLDGTWSLTVSEGSTLVFSSVGFYSQEVKVTNKATYDIVLKEDTTLLDEIVVVGFASQKKVNLTGSVAVATADDIKSRPVRDLPSSLQGVLPGLQVTTNDGSIGKTMQIKVRGTGTIAGESSDAPLILIDGMQGDINTLNPQDVESISVLKDAASASIYGSRAAFGVILITTKKGSAGKATVSYNNNFRFQSPTIVPQTMDSYTFALYFNSAAKNGARAQIYKDDTLQKMLDFQAAGGTIKGGIPKSRDGKTWGKPDYDPYTYGYANTDWFAELYKKNSFSQEHNVSVSGGTNSVRYYVSLGYTDVNGMIKYGEDNSQRYNVTANITADVTKWAQISYNERFIRSKTHTPASYMDANYWRIGRNAWPNLPVYDENGYFSSNGSGGCIPQQWAESGFDESVTDTYSQQGTLVLEPIKNWKTHFEFNARIMNRNRELLNLPLIEHDVNGDPIPTNSDTELTNSNTKSNHYNWNIYSNYQFSLGDHNFNVMAGFQSDHEISKSFSVLRTGVQDASLPVLDLTTGLDTQGEAKAPVISGNAYQWSTAGFFGRLNYDYKGRYLFEANLRYDGSSRFRADSRWTWAPSFSAGWNIAQEDWWERLRPTVNLLKLRLSYGTLANQNTAGYYPTYRTMTLGTSNGTWLQNGEYVNTARVGALISSALTWEKVTSYNAAVDFGALNNRLTGSAELFSRYTYNMVGPAATLPATLGLSAPRANNCDLKTTGWEFNITWKDRLRNGLGYSIAANISDSKTIILKYPNNPTHSINSYNEGHETGEIWGFETVGIAKTGEEMQAHLDKVGGQSALGSMWDAGDIMYADLDGQPGITKGAQTLEDHGDLKIIGNSNPHYFFGLTLSADYKGFDTRVFFQGVAQHDVWVSSCQFWGAAGYNMWFWCGYTVHEDYFRAEPIGLPGHEIPANTDAYYPRPVQGMWGTNKNQNVQTKYLQDASYVRLKNLQVGYTLPQSFTTKMGISRLRLFFSADNLLTFKKCCKVLDPETITGGDGGNAYPLSRTTSFGINVSF